ncbi:MAG: winged helix-turn-helix domain-containing protein [Thermaurantiacus sp.]
MHEPTLPNRATTSLADRQDCELGPLRVSPSRRLLMAGGAERMIEPRAMLVLLRLAEVPGQTVSRRDLVEDCWKVLYISDDAVNRVIATLRKALAALPEACVAVETVPRVGYRLRLDQMVPVSAGRPADDPIGQPYGLQRRTLIGWGAIIAGAAVVAATVLRSHGRESADALIAGADRDLLSLASGSKLRARAALEQAVARAPGNAEAWGKLAMAERDLAREASPPNVQLVEDAARKAAERAFALDPQQGDALIALATLEPMHGDWHASEERLLRARSVAPDNVHGREAHAALLSRVGRCRAAGALATETLEMAPHAQTVSRVLAMAQWADGRVEEALAVARSIGSGRLGPFYSWLLLEAGRPEEAEAELTEEQARQDPSHMLSATRLAITAARSRDPTDADAAEAALLRVAAIGGLANTAALIGLATIERLEQAFAVARRWYLPPAMPEAQSRAARHSMTTTALFLPPLAAMRLDRRWDGLVTDIGLADYWLDTGQRPDILDGKALPLPD